MTENSPILSCNIYRSINSARPEVWGALPIALHASQTHNTVFVSIRFYSDCEIF